MNLFNTIVNLLRPILTTEVIAIDRFTSCTVEYKISNFKEFELVGLNDITALISENDFYNLSFKIGENDALNLLKTNNLVFFEKIKEERELIEDEEVCFKLEITKGINKTINIYDFKSFEKFWQGKTLIEILSLLKEKQTLNNQIIFVLLEDECDDFYTQNIIFSSNPPKVGVNLNCAISDNCHFGNIEEYPFNAHYFNIIKRPIQENSISDILDKLCLLFCIISIFDITSIKGSKLYYKLNGYKSFEGFLDLDNLNIPLKIIYFKIFDWIYSENSKIRDKIGLARNIISLSLSEGDLFISESVFLSLQSAYKAYLQENISKYIEIRNKIIDELSWISHKSGEIIESYLSNYQKSIFTFLSFFISVFLLKFINKNEIKEVFTKTETIFSLAFLFLSIMYLFFSLWNLHLEKKRLIRKYANLKNRFTDLLDKNDIKRILKDDEEFNYEIEYIDRRKTIYTILWCITILVLIITILSVSNYLNWEIINNCIIEHLKYISFLGSIIKLISNSIIVFAFIH